MKKSNVGERAQALLAKNPLIIDTETTGLNRPEIIQMTIVDSTGAVLLNQRYRPLTAIHPDASRINGHTAESLVNEPSWKDSDVFYNLLLNQTITAYNLNFDDVALRSTMAIHNMALPHYRRGDCIMELFAEVYGDWSRYHGSYKWKTLRVAANHYGIQNPAAHDAQADYIS